MVFRMCLQARAPLKSALICTTHGEQRYLKWWTPYRCWDERDVGRLVILPHEVEAEVGLASSSVIPFEVR